MSKSLQGLQKIGPTWPWLSHLLPLHHILRIALTPIFFPVFATASSSPNILCLVLHFSLLLDLDVSSVSHLSQPHLPPPAVWVALHLVHLVDLFKVYSSALLEPVANQVLLSFAGEVAMAKLFRSTICDLPMWSRARVGMDWGDTSTSPSSHGQHLEEKLWPSYRSILPAPALGRLTPQAGKGVQGETEKRFLWLHRFGKMFLHQRTRG